MECARTAGGPEAAHATEEAGASARVMTMHIRKMWYRSSSGRAGPKVLVTSDSSLANAISWARRDRIDLRSGCSINDRGDKAEQGQRGDSTNRKLATQIKHKHVPTNPADGLLGGAGAGACKCKMYSRWTEPLAECHMCMKACR